MRSRFIHFISLTLAVVTVSAAEQIAPKTLAFLQETTISGYVQSSYQYTVDHSGNPGNAGGRLFNNNGNDFAFDQFKLTLERPSDEVGYAAGYRVDMLAGRDAERIHSYGLFSDESNELRRRTGTDQSAIDLEQAYVSLRLPAGNGLEAKFGKFVSPAGAETIDAPGNWFYSRSYIFSFGEPFTFTGLLLNYRWNDIVETQAGVVNGWDAVTDNNSGKTGLGRIGLNFFDGKLKNAVTVVGGPEQPSDNSNCRWIVDDVLTWQPPMENLLIQVNAMYGQEDNAIDSAGFEHRGEFSWWGASAAARYQWNPLITMALRAEYFSDTDGARTDGATGLRTLIGPQPDTARGFSNLHGVDYQAVTWSVWLERIFPNLTPRVELRWDRANEGVFRAQTNNGVFDDGATTQFSVSVDAVYVF